VANKEKKDIWAISLSTDFIAPAVKHDDKGSVKILVIYIEFRGIIQVSGNIVPENQVVKEQRMTTKGQELQVMLLASTGRDDVVVTATAISDIDESRPGHFSRLVRINRGQGVAFDGQTLSAEYNHAKSRWQVLHPCA